MRRCCPPVVALLLVAALLAGCSQPNPSYRGKTAQQWIECLNTKDAAEKRLAVEALVACGPEALGRLSDAIADSDRDIRTGAACVLLQMGEPGRGLVRQRLDDVEPAVRISVARACFQHNLEGEKAVEVVLAGLQNPDSHVRHQAIHVLGDLSAASTTAVPPLVAALQSADDDTRWRAAHALNRIGPGARSAVAALTEALKDSDARVRHGAAQALGAIGPEARTATEALLAALNDRDEEVRWRAGEVLKAWNVEVRQAAHHEPIRK